MQLRTKFCTLSILAFVASLLFSRLILAEDTAASWKQFRGDNTNGLALSADLPTEWSEEKNVLWSTPIHGRGWSSPVVDQGEIWLTTATLNGKKMSALCVDFESGKILHDLLLFENAEVQQDHHVTNSFASPTPIIEGENVYISFGAYGTACLRRSTGEVLWQRRDLPCNHYRGAGSSPILYQDLLIFHMDGFDHQYAVALDKKSGKTVWKQDRDIDYGTTNGDFFKAFSTPIVIQVNGRDQLISPASKTCLALDPLTGKEIWRVRYAEHSTTVRPLFDGTSIYLSTGFGRAKMMSVRVDGMGDVTDTHVNWVQPKSIGSKPSPVLIDGLLFDVTDTGIFERLDAKTGEIVWKTRLEGKFSASLVANSKYIYLFNHENTGWVYTIGEEPELVAMNKLPDGCNASPAIADDSLVVRTTKSLYRISGK
ncbi:MAG: PQQ-binding-like beta-propeller repeat protein [Planctomycetota bacterium]